jgi:hypothetical protein
VVPIRPKPWLRALAWASVPDPPATVAGAHFLTSFVTSMLVTPLGTFDIVFVTTSTVERPGLT